MGRSSATTAVEIDSEVLERLRARDPGRNDRELLEDLALIELGRTTIIDVQRRLT